MSNSFTETDIIAMKALLARVLRAADEKIRIEAARRLLDAEYEATERLRSAAINAFSAFGFRPADKDVWDAVRLAMGDDAWFDSFVLGGRPSPKQAEEEEKAAEAAAAAAAVAASSADAPDKVGDSDGISDDDGATVSPTEADTDAPEGMPTVREIAVARLAAAGDVGTKASAIREYIQETYNRQVHEKTVGMTLYRLSKEGLARRDKRTWFSAKPPAETENPGGETPGPEDVQPSKEDV